MHSANDQQGHGVAVPNKLAPLRDAKGRLLPGSTGNPNGRPKGSVNNTTKRAAQRLAAHADKAAKVIIEALDAPEQWARVGAAKLILERSDLFNDDGKVDLNYATEREERILAKLVARIQARMARGQQVRDVLADEQPQHPASEFRGVPPVIDVQPLVIPLKTEAQ